MVNLALDTMAVVKEKQDDHGGILLRWRVEGRTVDGHSSYVRCVYYLSRKSEWNFPRVDANVGVRAVSQLGLLN